MKTLSLLIASAFMLLLVAGCGKDNYDAPSSMLSGRIVYNGTPIGLKGTNGTVQLQLWERGHALFTPIPVYVHQDGSFSAILFNGSYMLVHRDGNGPWVNSHDTVRFTVNGSSHVDYPVTPYYMISDVQHTLDNNLLKMSFKVEGIDNSRKIEYVTLMANKTQFVDFTSNSKRTDLQGVVAGQVELSMDVSDLLANEKAVFARIGLKVEGVEEGIYTTEVVRIK